MPRLDRLPMDAMFAQRATLAPWFIGQMIGRPCRTSEACCGSPTTTTGRSTTERRS